MTPERWQKVEEIFETAVELPGPEREAFLTRVCNGDDELRAEIASLLANEVEETFFQSAVAGGAQTFARAGVEGIVGQRIGVYRLTALVGQGGMGAVYSAVRDDDQFNQRVAIKIIKRGMDTGFVLRRFRRERQILASFNHPNIARLLDGGTIADGRPYFVLEFIEGQPISDYCDAHQLSIPDRLKLFRHVCAAVQFAHQNLVVHRDLKPGNILVAEDGAPKLLDFGIAKLPASETGPASTRTVTGMRMMTPDYASPEQVRGGTITTASDIYSLGTVLYELLTGQRANLAVSHSRMGDVLSVRGDLPAALEHLLQAHAACQAVVEEQPDNAQARRQLIPSYANLANLLGNPTFLNLGDTAAAIAHQRKAVAIAEELAAADPKNARARGDLNTPYRGLGQILGEINPAEAVKAFDRAFDMATPSGRPVSREYEALYHAEVALPLLRMGGRASARRHASQAQEALSAIPAQKRMIVGFIADQLYLAIADVLLDAGDWAGALTNYRQALSFIEEAVTARPFMMERRSRLAGCYEKLGKYHAALAAQAGLATGQQIEHWRQARQSNQKAMQVWNEWTQWGTSSAYDVRRKEQTARVLAECDTALAKLGAR